MSNSKLDQSLEDILDTRKKTAGRRGRGRRVPNGARVTTAAPSGGVQKKAKAANGVAKVVVPVGPAAGSGDSKIIVSNLPSDVTEQQIKEYFQKSVGPVKRAMLTYGPNGISRGVSTIIFSKPDGAAKAISQLNGVKVDNRPMRVEVVVNATNAKAAAPMKGLGDRVQSKNQSKPAAPKPATNAAAAARGAKGKRGGRRGRAGGRPKPKTADELDAEMVDYFDSTAQNGEPADGTALNSTAQPAANGEDLGGMDDIS